MFNYKDVFNKIENKIKEISTLSSEEFEKEFGSFKSAKDKLNNDSEVFDLLTRTPFYAGMKANTVDNKLPIIKKHFPDYKKVSSYNDGDIANILNDQSMIKNRKKIIGSIDNAKEFKSIIEQNGSFYNYINGFNPEKSFNNLKRLRDQLIKQFVGLGPRTSYHFMSEIGLSVLKPDRVILRIFNRLGLLLSENPDEDNFDHAIMQGMNFSAETGYPIRYIDIIIVKYGQMGGEAYGLDDGICLDKNPKCHICSITAYCNYYLSERKIRLLP